MSEKIYLNDVGSVMLIRVIDEDSVETISDATLMKLYITKPNRELVEWTCSLYADNQQITYTLIAGDVDKKGTYVGNAYVETPSGTWTGETFSFQVYNKGE